MEKSGKFYYKKRFYLEKRLFISMKENIKAVDKTKNCILQVIKESDANYKFY